MAEDKAIVEVRDNPITIQDAVIRYNLLVDCFHQVMKKDIDYGVIPGSDKPSLLKPGAEKLRFLFRLQAPIYPVSQVEDWEHGFFSYVYRCEISDNGKVVASCEGSTNSKEKKYRYRNVMGWEATDEDKSKAIKITDKIDKHGKPYKIYKLENTEPFDLVNTLRKMAQKRAFVGAVLIGANASEFFTQDIEDYNKVDESDFEEGEFEETSKPAKSNGNNNPNPQRPFSPETVLKAIQGRAEVTFKGKPATEKQRGLMTGVLETCFATGDSEMRRHKVCKYLTGKSSMKDIPDSFVLALLDWLAPEKDSGGAYQPNKFSVVEAGSIYGKAMADNPLQDELA